MKTLGIVIAVVCALVFVVIALTGIYVLGNKSAEKKVLNKNKKKKPSNSIPKPPPMKIKKGIYDDYCE